MAKIKVPENRAPKGKTALYHYVTKENRLYLLEKAKKHGISESRILDLIIDDYRLKHTGLKINL